MSSAAPCARLLLTAAPAESPMLATFLPRLLEAIAELDKLLALRETREGRKDAILEKLAGLRKALGRARTGRGHRKPDQRDRGGSEGPLVLANLALGQVRGACYSAAGAASGALFLPQLAQRFECNRCCPPEWSNHAADCRFQCAVLMAEPIGQLSSFFGM